jgi:hypothetical protein
MDKKSPFDRLREIQAHERDLFVALNELHEERDRLLSELGPAQQPQQDPQPATGEPPVTVLPVKEPRTGKKCAPLPLPLGKNILPGELKRLKQEISEMDPAALDTQGRIFIQEWYPKLCKTPAWHEVSTALQQHFGAKRQQVAGMAARIVRKTAESSATFH